MSLFFPNPSKIEELVDAKKAGFKIYLYFVTTSDPLINLQRVKNRVESGGHDVLQEKVNSRYYRTMNNLYEALKLADRAYLFDNFRQKANGSFDFFAEKNGPGIYVSSLFSAPQWFEEYVLNKVPGLDLIPYNRGRIKPSATNEPPRPKGRGIA